MKRFFAFCALAATLAASYPAFGQTFGKNKIQYKKLDWKYLQSKHFDIYFYQNGDRVAKTVAAIAESSYSHLSRSFNYDLRERISIVLYNSHNDFEETNLSWEIQDEATGGFTEFLKNRVVLPYEGSLEQLRHVVHHELTHAVTLQFYFGTGPGAIITGLSRLQMPLWYVEGLAEYESRDGWNTEAEQIVRDAVITGYLPQINRLDFMAYQGGQSLFYYIEQRYGRGKVTELYNAVKLTRSVPRGFQKALGQDLESFSKKWHKHLKETYWPEIKEYDTPDEFATPLTDHEKSRNFINNGPALSPKGDMVAFLSDKDGLFDIYLMSTLDRNVITKLVTGQRSAHVEELHWLRPGISWAPDSRRIVFSAKAGRTDVLHIVDVRKSKIRETLRWKEMDGVFSPSWSPDGDKIVFVGMREGKSDLYVYNLKSKDLDRLTDDQFSDLEPSWSPDSKKIVFTSDRGDNLKTVNDDVDVIRHNYRHTDIFIFDYEQRTIQRVTRDLSNEKSADWFQGSDTLMYVSDRNGIFNIYLHDLKTGEDRHLTNLLTGANQLSIARESTRLAFTTFYKGGYDIYLWKNPLQNVEVPDTLRLTDYIRNERPYDPDSPRRQEYVASISATTESSRPFRHYVFGREFAEGRFALEGDSSVALAKDEYMTEAGGFRKRDYRPKFSIDYAGAVGGYNTFFGVQGATQIVLSDLLSNHQIAIQANIIRSLQNSSIAVSYVNLSRRWDYGLTGYHFAQFYQTIRPDGFVTIERFRNYGLGGSISYPFSRFRRVDFSANWYNVKQDDLYFGSEDDPGRLTTTVLFSGSYVVDNSVWAYTGPFDGNRINFSVTYSPKLGKNGLDFTTLNADIRRYWKMGREYSFALRVAGGASLGENPTAFLIGGVPNWINYKFARNISSDLVRNFYFSQFIWPLRGASFYEQIGDRYFIANLELKFPLIQYFITQFPLPLGFANIRGAAFVDVGSAWIGDDFNLTRRDQNGNRVLDDLLMGFGWGLRTPFLIGLLRLDQAWSTDLHGVTKPTWYISFGVDY